MQSQNKIRTATISFHASHNYGSMLQAYALQQFLINTVGVDNYILNFRSTIQKKTIYPKPSDSVIGFILSKILRLKKWRRLDSRHDAFEHFLINRLKLSNEISNPKDLSYVTEGLDYIIAGSDQIWNTTCEDFNWCYYIDFSNIKHISYAASMGPYPERALNSATRDRITTLLGSFSGISVRENRASQLLHDELSIDSEVHIDPTLLLGTNEWNKIISNERIVEEPYILIYSPSSIKPGMMELANEIAKSKGYRIVTSNKLSYKTQLKYSQCNGYQRVLDLYSLGPSEFLNLIKNAEMIISSSFHATLFSLLFKKPCFSYNGDIDARINTLLKNSSSEDLAFNKDNWRSLVKNDGLADYLKFEAWLEAERSKSLDYLKEHLFNT